MQQNQVEKIKFLVKSSSLFTDAERSEWLQLTELMNDKQLLELEKILTAARPAEKKPQPEAVHLNHILNAPNAKVSTVAAQPMPIASAHPASPVAKQSPALLRFKNKLATIFGEKELTTSKQEFPIELPAGGAITEETERAEPSGAKKSTRQEQAASMPSVTLDYRGLESVTNPSHQLRSEQSKRGFAGEKTEAVSLEAGKVSRPPHQPIAPERKLPAPPPQLPVAPQAPALSVPRPPVRPKRSWVPVPLPPKRKKDALPSAPKAESKAASHSAEGKKVSSSRPISELHSPFSQSGIVKTSKDREVLPRSPAAQLASTSKAAPVAPAMLEDVLKREQALSRDKETIPESRAHASVAKDLGDLSKLKALSREAALPSSPPSPIHSGSPSPSPISKKITREPTVFRAGLQNTKIFLDAKLAKPGSATVPVPSPASAHPTAGASASKPVPAATLNSINDVSSLDIGSWKRQDLVAMIKKIQQLIQAHGYHEVMFGLERSPIYKSYVDTGVRLLREGGSFESFEGTSGGHTQYLTRQEFERFTDMLRQIQAG